MHKFLLVFLFTILLNTQPLFSKSNTLDMRISTSLNSKNTLGFYNNLRSKDKNNINFNLRHSKKNLSSQLTFNFVDNKIKLDNSYASYQMGITNINIGKINRIWSFSNKSSLILSSNARPLDAVSIKLENKFNTRWLPEDAKWSIEAITASNKKSFSDNNSILSGARLFFSPTKRLDFEIFQTSQWGGNNNKLDSSTIGTILLGNSNEGYNSDINKMAGFGISYLMPFNENNRIYGQAVGEDEAGGLPSCYGWMAGIELSRPKIRFPTVTTIEFVDTRVPYSTHGNCGPNTMYNNGIYDYSNYGVAMGVPIDTEGNSLEVFGKTRLSENLSINYSLKLLNINDKNYSHHRLSTVRSTGSINSLGFSWKKNTLDIDGSISFQDLTLDKVDVEKGVMFSLTSSVNF